MYDAERGKEPWWVQGGAGDQRACVRLCACLCLPVPVACRQAFDARHNFIERIPAGFQIPSGMFDVYFPYSSIPTRISGLSCGLLHLGRAARNRVCSSCVSILDRLSLVSSSHKGAFVSSFFDGPLFALGLPGDSGFCSLVYSCTPGLLFCTHAWCLGTVPFCPCFRSLLALLAGPSTMNLVFSSTPPFSPSRPSSFSAASLLSWYVRPLVTLPPSPAYAPSPSLLISALRKPMVVPYLRLSLSFFLSFRVGSLLPTCAHFVP